MPRNEREPRGFRGTDIPNTNRSEIARSGFDTNRRSPNDRVRDVMTRNPRTVRRDDSLEEAARLMRECDCGAVPVVDDDRRKPVGIITDRDIVVRSIGEGKNPSDLRVSDCMSSNVFTVQEDDSLQRVFDVMSDHRVRRVPVVDRNERLVGIIAQADVALKSDQEQRVEQTVENISKPSRSPRS